MNIIRKTLLVILLLFFPQTLYAEIIGHYQCDAIYYANCDSVMCMDFEDKVEIYVDMIESKVLRETKTNSKDFMDIKNFWVSENKHLYVHYEDSRSHGFIVISYVYENKYSYTDTLFTNMGGWVSSGYCNNPDN